MASLRPGRVARKVPIYREGSAHPGVLTEDNFRRSACAGAAGRRRRTPLRLLYLRIRRLQVRVLPGAQAERYSQRATRRPQLLLAADTSISGRRSLAYWRCYQLGKERQSWCSQPIEHIERKSDYSLK